MCYLKRSLLDRLDRGNHIFILMILIFNSLASVISVQQIVKIKFIFEWLILSQFLIII